MIIRQLFSACEKNDRIQIISFYDFCHSHNFTFKAKSYTDPEAIEYGGIPILDTHNLNHYTLGRIQFIIYMLYINKQLWDHNFIDDLTQERTESFFLDIIYVFDMIRYAYELDALVYDEINSSKIDPASSEIALKYSYSVNAFYNICRDAFIFREYTLQSICSKNIGSIFDLWIDRGNGCCIYDINTQIAQTKVRLKLIDNCELRYNRYHDERGKFCAKEDAVFIDENYAPSPVLLSDPPLTTLTSDDIDYIRIELSKKGLAWSDEVISYIRNLTEAKIYMDLGLREAQINGRNCLIRDDIDLDFITPLGITNRELLSKGRAPYLSNGEQVHLHHIGQRDDSPLAELTESEHIYPPNHLILHDISYNSNIIRTNFDTIRRNHWIERSGNGE